MRKRFAKRKNIFSLRQRRLSRNLKHGSDRDFGKTATESFRFDRVKTGSSALHQKTGRWLHEVRNLMISLPTPFNPMYYQSA